MGLRTSYTILAPLYDKIVAKASAHWRKQSFESIKAGNDFRILLNGIGTGLDVPWLSDSPLWHGVDITPAMLKRAQHRYQQQLLKTPDLKLKLQQGDVMCLPYQNNQFDWVIMHLILAVVPNPVAALQEAERVLKPGGRIRILDKFLRPGQLAPFRRTINLLMRHIATRLDVVFEDVLKTCPTLQIIDDTTLKPGKWFRIITLEKKNPTESQSS